MKKFIDDLTRLTLEEQQFIYTLIYGEFSWKKSVTKVRRYFRRR